MHLVFLSIGCLLMVELRVCTPVPDVTSCREPDDFDQTLAAVEVGDHLSVILPPPIRNDLNRLNRKSSDRYPSVYTGPDQMLYGNKTCPSKLPYSMESLQQDRSTCPYYYVISHDATRYPAAIAEARCKCVACVDPSNGDNLCEAIYFQKMILRKTGCANGIYTYVPEVYNVQNGCICTQRRFISNSAEQNGTPTTETEDEDTTDGAETPTGTTSLPFNVH